VVSAAAIATIAAGAAAYHLAVKGRQGEQASS
jgi:hypothetical protein